MVSIVIIDYNDTSVDDGEKININNHISRLLLLTTMTVKNRLVVDDCVVWYYWNQNT